jgi:methyl-accepting chemotaxis protein
VVAGVGALVAVVAGWFLLGTVGESVKDTVTVSRRALVTVGETTRVVDEVFDDVAGSLRDVQITLTDTSLSLTRAAVITGNLGEVVTDEVPASVDAVRASLPALIDTARVIDRTMRGLALFGVDYDPDVRLDDSIATIDERLAEIPALLRAQQGTLADVASDLGTFASSSLEIGADLSVIRVRLAEASVVLDGYASLVEESTGVLDDVESAVDSGVGVLRLVLMLVGMGVAATQTVPIFAGISVVRTRPASAGR